MKAIRVEQAGGPEVMRLVEMPDPAPGPGEVLVQVRAAGVNPVDTYIRSGIYPGLVLPYTPGLDAAGIVEATWEGVSRVKTGDRVYVYTSSGTYAEKVVCPEARVFPLPDGVSLAQGAAIGVPYGTAYRALFHRAYARPGEVVLVHGASGGVGTAAVQLARAAGLTVIGTAGTEAGRKLALEQGAHHMLDHHSPDYLEQARALTGGNGIDVILELLANVNLGKDLPVLARNGRVVVIGSRGRVEIDPRDTMGREASILGVTLSAASPEDLASIHAALRAGLENGSLHPVVGREVPLAEAPRAHEAVMDPGAHGKIILIS